MAVIHFTPADALQTQIVEAGIYPSMMIKCEGPKASSSGKSNNYYAEIQIVDGKYKGKVKKITFNTGVDDMFAPGSMQMEPFAKLLVMNAAIKNAKVEVADVSLDTDDLLNKPFESQWVVSTVEGQLHNNVTNFFPLGTAVKQPGW
jgi:hypothetical protein